VHARRLSEALKIIGERKFDVVLSDLDLPDSQELATLSAIVKWAPQLPVVILTGFDDEKLGIEALQKGAQDYLVKGKIQSGLLIKTIRYSIERKKRGLLNTQLELEKVKRLSDIGTLAATVAHELRNPLAAISMAAHNIKRKAKNPDLDKHLANIEKKVSESDIIISNLLFYSRIKPPHYENVNISAIIEEAVDHIRENCKRNETIIADIEALKTISIEADPVQIKEVVHNIMNNACDAVPPEGGRLEITGACDEEAIKIVFKDNGQGIKKENLAKVFDPFFTTKAKGTGLGLSVCRQIVDLHGGSIEIESEPGKGTSLIVRLPRAAKNP
jgi:signal transduction histidine kinase